MNSKNSMIIAVVSDTLKHLQDLNEKSELPKKFSIAFITKHISEISKTYKKNKENNKTGKKTVYNLFVQEYMPIVHDDNPELDNHERLKLVSEMWKEFKEENPDYRDMYAKKMEIANRNITKKSIKEEKEIEIEMKKEEKKKEEKKKEEKKGNLLKSKRSLYKEEEE
jgi:hypothetical protein